MKLSLKLHNNNESQKTTQTQIMTAKVPITLFNNPLISTITATGNSTSDFSFSHSTNFPSGPSFKLSYSPTLPFSLSLKSGLGLFGSPHHSPLVFSANFSLSQVSSSTLLLPSFSLQFKPQFGHFSLHKTVNSDSEINPKIKTFDNPLSSLPQFEKGFVPFSDGCSSGWQNLKLEPVGHTEENGNGVGVGVDPDGKNIAKCGLSPCIGVMAKTILPVTQGLLLNFRWGVNFPRDSGFKMPYLTVNKIGLERVEEVKTDNFEGDSKGMKMKDVCVWTKKDLENVEKENKEIKRVLNEMKMEVSSGEWKLPKQKQDSGESFESWRGSNRNNGKQENEKKQANKAQKIVVSDLESELEKAIKAASS